MEIHQYGAALNEANFHKRESVQTFQASLQYKTEIRFVCSTCTLYKEHLYAFMLLSNQAVIRQQRSAYIRTDGGQELPLMFMSIIRMEENVTRAC